MSIRKTCVITGALIGATVFFGLSLVSSRVSADDTVVDDVILTVPVACTLSGTGMNTHNATINPGSYETDIGTTTLKAFCNDVDGFAIYAIGFTDDTDGKNVLTNSTLGSNYDIVTGTSTSGNSQWAMKLSTQTSPTPAYPITIQSSFGAYHTVPNNYMLVASRDSATDVGTGATGSTLTSTYQVYISTAQPAGTYTGQVKYVMVHPSETNPPVRSDQIAVVYDGNGLTFSGGASTNRVLYGSSNCSSEYVGTTPTIVKSPNVSDDGSLIRNYNNENVFQTVSFNGATKIRVVLDFGIVHNTGIYIVEGDEWGGISEDGLPSGDYYGVSGWDNMSDGIQWYNGTRTFVLDGDAVTLELNGQDGGNYGMYARVYPIYSSEQAGSVERKSCSIDSTPVSGSYAVPTGYDVWYMMANGLPALFDDESEILDYLEENQMILFGKTVYIYAYNPYSIVYNGNGATGGTKSGYYTTLDFITDKPALAAPNFYKNNNGFIGWSESPNATPNSGTKIYGPNESVSGLDLNFDSSTHETTLYAVWMPSSGSLQNWSGCAGLGQGKVVALTDTRDSNTYAVAKLADGNCWMIENLRLDAVNSGDETKAQGFGGVFDGLASSESANFTNTTTGNSKYSTSNITGNYQGYRFPRYNNSNTSSFVTNMTSENSNIYSYGNYYTWAAAMANTTMFSTSSDSESSNTSICPSGWRLPYGNDGQASGGLYYLLYKMNGDNWDIDTYIFASALEVYPYNFVFSGFINGSSFLNRGFSGWYWTLTNSDSDYNLARFTSEYGYTISGKSVGLFNATNKTAGLSIRCLIMN